MQRCHGPAGVAHRREAGGAAAGPQIHPAPAGDRAGRVPAGRLQHLAPQAAHHGQAAGIRAGPRAHRCVPRRSLAPSRRLGTPLARPRRDRDTTSSCCCCWEGSVFAPCFLGITVLQPWRCPCSGSVWASRHLCVLVSSLMRSERLALTHEVTLPPPLDQLHDFPPDPRLHSFPVLFSWPAGAATAAEQPPGLWVAPRDPQPGLRGPQVFIFRRFSPQT